MLASSLPGAAASFSSVARTMSVTRSVTLSVVRVNQLTLVLSAGMSQLSSCAALT